MSDRTLLAGQVPSMITSESPPAVPTPQRHWFQFWLGTLLAFVTLCASLCCCLAVKITRQREAVAAIKKVGGDVIFGWQVDDSGYWYPNKEPTRPAWLRNLLGDEHPSDVMVLLNGITDTDLQPLRSLNHLKALTIRSYQFTDAGLEILEGMNQVEELDLQETHITDAGLEPLKGLSQLKELDLSETLVTDEGVENLQQALPNCTITK